MYPLSNEMTDEDIILKAKEIVSRRFLRSDPMSSITDIANYFIIQNESALYFDKRLLNLYKFSLEQNHLKLKSLEVK